MTVDMTFRTEPKISMNIGSLTDNGASYFVFSSTLPSTDPFCTLDAEPLKPFKAGPTGFEKK